MGESRTQSVNVAARPKCTQTVLVLAIQQRRTGDSMALRFYYYFTPTKHTYTSREREGGRERQVVSLR